MTTLAEIESILEDGLSLAQKLAPIVGPAFGPAGAAAGALIGQLAGFADTVVPQIQNDATIIASGDPTKLLALQAQLQAENAALNAQVAAS